ncbi:MAG TPA: GAF domain-containing protein [Acidimicrobiales bacterium]|nr:GAF domain-containing protein [Acidimicrobiales bacterium]
MSDGQAPPALRDLHYCFEGAVPAVIATVAADGTPNVTDLSKVRRVDDERVALSNQFFSKTARNLADNPRASVLVLDPSSYDQYRLTLVYERTDRRGPVFERLRDDLDVAAALEGMQDVFKLRAADIYRVVHVEQVLAAAHAPGGTVTPRAPHRHDAVDAARVAELGARLSRCPDLDTLVDATVHGLAELFGYEHSLLLLVDEQGTHLYTIASHGYAAEGVGSEVAVGEGVVGMAAARCAPVTVGNLRQVTKYSRTVRRSYEDRGEVAPGREVPVPALPRPQSRVAVPAMALGQLVGVLMIESDEQVAFGPSDEAVLTMAAALVANAIEIERARERAADVPAGGGAVAPVAPAPADATLVRFFAVDGSTFVDGDYLVKGVAGRILWSLLRHHDRDGRVEFTNREVRLDPSLELPELRDNFESRLILLKRRLDERAAPVRIEKTGRGRFRLAVGAPLRLDCVGCGDAG